MPGPTLAKRLLAPASGGGGGSGIVSSGSASGLTVNFTALEDDWVFCIVSVARVGVTPAFSWGGTAGWTVGSGGNFWSGNRIEIGYAYKKMGASPDSSFTFTCSPTLSNVNTVFAVVRGSYPGVIGGPQFNGITDGQIDPPSISGISAGDGVLIYGVRGGTTASVTPASPYDSNWVQASSSYDLNSIHGIAFNDSPSTPTEDPGAFTGGPAGSESQWSASIRLTA